MKILHAPSKKSNFLYIKQVYQQPRYKNGILRLKQQIPFP